MAIKGTLATFDIGLLKQVTVDERRSVRNFLREKNPDLSTPSLEALQKTFSDCMISEEEMIVIENGLTILPEVLERVKWFIEDIQKDPKNYESINVHRLKSTIEEIPKHLQKNVDELRKLMSFQHAVPVGVKQLIDAARNAKSPEELSQIPPQGFKLMCTAANDDKGVLCPDERINESHQSHMKDISERFKTGYVYHWSIEDELQKVPFAEIFSRLDTGQQDQFNTLSSLLDELNKAIDTTYNLNWKQIGMIRRIYSVLHECLNKYFEN
ncbi:hypothetical protein ACFL96_10905 [Thermoproteota archaeon]